MRPNVKDKLHAVCCSDIEDTLSKWAIDRDFFILISTFSDLDLDELEACMEDSVITTVDRRLMNACHTP